MKRKDLNPSPILPYSLGNIRFLPVSFPPFSLDVIALLSSLQLVTALCRVAALHSSCATVSKDLFNRCGNQLLRVT
jgi:hypothetical protein